MSSQPESSLPTLIEAIFKGGVGFAVASLCVFATVAFAERWMYTQLGQLGAYLAWIILFVGLGGALLGTLVIGRWELPRFYILFGAAFFAYAVAWVCAYFALRGGAGEWVGSLVGSLMMGIVFAAGFKTPDASLQFAAILFVANSIGYFIGSALDYSIGGRPGMLLWGIVYGLFLGAGIGAVLQLAQARSTGR
jgi:hypothetical protein